MGVYFLNTVYRRAVVTVVCDRATEVHDNARRKAIRLQGRDSYTSSENTDAQKLLQVRIDRRE